jgi:DNA-binding response OmpR family regulator
MFSPNGSGTVLIVEDDERTASLVALYLEREGFRTAVARDGRQALALAKRNRPIFVILDLMLPVVDGWEVCREIRRWSDVPILMLTARGEEVDRVSGLTLGADDYLVKPFSPRELVARVKAILRRGRVREGEPQTVLAWEGLTLDREKRRVAREGRAVELTAHEYRILEALMESPGRVFTRSELLERLYPRGEALVIDRVVDVHVGKLRQKIESDPSQPRYILTARGLGYRFADEAGP